MHIRIIIIIIITHVVLINILKTLVSFSLNTLIVIISQYISSLFHQC